MGRRRFEIHSGSILADSGEITIQALGPTSSAAGKIVRNAAPLPAPLAYVVLMECSVRSAFRLVVGRMSSIETPVTSSGVPSRDPPSALMITAPPRGNPRGKPPRIF